MSRIKLLADEWESNGSLYTSVNEVKEKDKFISYVIDAVCQVKNDLLTRDEIENTMNNILNKYGEMLERI